MVERGRLKSKLPAKDVRRIEKYVRDRIRDYPKYINLGPGEDEDPITLITIGYSDDQHGWLTLVFDTRPDAETDGEWTHYIEENWLEMPHWVDAFTGPEVPGEAIAKVLSEADFGMLPLAPNHALSVEHLLGSYGWPFHESDEEIALANVVQRVKKLSKKKQIAFWIDQLDKTAAGKPCETLRDSAYGIFCDHQVEHLSAVGQAAVIPMLELASKWSSQPEWEGDRPKRKIVELPVQDVVFHILCAIQTCKTSPEIEKHLRTIVRKSVRANANRRLWGIIPWHAARTLHALNPAYPEPRTKATTNALLNAEQFARKR